MHKKDSFALVQLVENGIESFVAHVDAVGIGEDAEPNSAEGIESIVDFGERVLDRGKRERSKEAEVIRVRSTYFGKLLVGGAGDLFCERCVEWLQVGTGSADAEDGGGDVILFHHGDVLFWCPFLDMFNGRSCIRDVLWVG